MNLYFMVFLLIILEMLFMFPLKDDRSRQAGFPWVTVSLIVINTVIHFGVTILMFYYPPEPDQPSFLYPYMEVPAHLLTGQGLGALSALTSFFLHGGFMHWFGNMVFLWFFGRKVEDVTGPLRFGLFYLLCGFSASLFSVLIRGTLSPFGAMIPGLGASGAIAGVMGAYLFLYSEQRILTLFSIWLAPVIPIPFFNCIIPLPLPIRLPAWVFLIYTFTKDALWAQLTVEIIEQQGQFFTGINVFAHLGGALAGVLFIYLFLHPEALVQRR